MSVRLTRERSGVRAPLLPVGMGVFQYGKLLLRFTRKFPEKADPSEGRKNFFEICIFYAMMVSTKERHDFE